MPGGAPQYYKTQEELQQKINEYLHNCPDKRKIITKEGLLEIPHLTITGLCYYLGFESRQSFYDYEKRDKFSYTIKRARLFIEKEYEILLIDNPTGAIFALKNFGWSDKQEHEHSGAINMQKFKATEFIKTGDKDTATSANDTGE